MYKKPVFALIYDFDRTLCTKDMHEYSFIPSLKMEPEEFWEQAEKLACSNKMDQVLAHMYLVLSKARAAKKPITRENFVELGKGLEFFPGVESWFSNINEFAEGMNAAVEHYVISSGLKEIIEGSIIYKSFNEVFASEYYYDKDGDACWPKISVNCTTKTQFLFRINKGVLDISDDDNLNRYTPEYERPVPFGNMIYIGDGLTDVPCMKLVKSNGGYSIAVYQEGKKSKAENFLKHGRVDLLALADYSQDSELSEIVKQMLSKMALGETLKRKSMKKIEQIDFK